ncbi:hypothetical protein [Streptomyces sp. NPDC001292]|uniref:hypothetical protein n=1 Tax=Streptomyces sp. NPDC001292 TaxID=3364558 RepID=UPI0036786DEE
MVTARRPCPLAPGPLEKYPARFDDLFPRWHSGVGSGSTWPGCWSRWERNKTLTALAGAEPVTGAQHPAVQRLQFLLSESRWDLERVNARRLELLQEAAIRLLLAGPATPGAAAERSAWDVDVAVQQPLDIGDIHAEVVEDAAGA